MMYLILIHVSIFLFKVVVTVSGGEAIRVIVGSPTVSTSDPSAMSIVERLDFITW